MGDLLYAGEPKARVSEKDWADLIQAIAERDQRALYALYERAHRLVFTLIVRITDDREAAEELTLDVFHDVWRRAPAYEPAGGPVLGWIMNQARSRAIDRLRYAQRKKRVQGDVDDSPVPPAGTEPHEALAVTEEARLLRQALQVLTPPEREAIETAFFAELTYGEVASQLDQPLGTVKTRIRSGLGKLRQALAPLLKGDR